MIVSSHHTMKSFMGLCVAISQLRQPIHSGVYSVHKPEDYLIIVFVLPPGPSKKTLEGERKAWGRVHPAGQNYSLYQILLA